MTYDVLMSLMPPRTFGVPQYAALGLAASMSVVAAGQVSFVEHDPADIGLVSASSALGMTTGIAVADYDNDGDIDLFVPTRAGTPDQLYVNQGDGTFVEVAADVGLASTGKHRAGLWLDYNGDRRLDLVVAGDCFVGISPNVCETIDDIRLFEQQPEGEFVDVTVQAGLDALWYGVGNAHRGGLAAGDLNNDGWLDLVTCFWRGPIGIMMNTGSGAFTDSTIDSGIGNSIHHAWQPIIHDFNGDGWSDIFFAVDYDPNLLWINQGDGTFVEQAAAWGVDSAFNEMGIALGDADNDGDFDIFVTNIHDFTGPDAEHNVLFERVSTVPVKGDVPPFVEQAATWAVGDTGWGWGTTFLDADHDGWLDLAATNGFNHEPWHVDPSRFFRNPGRAGAPFTDVSDTCGFNDTRYGNALVAADIDRDGDGDLLQTTQGPGIVHVVRNDSVKAGRWLTVRPRMVHGGNHRAIGAVVRIETRAGLQQRLIAAGTSHLGQEPAEAHFGLGSAAVVDRLIIHWPDGRETVATDVPGNRMADISDCNDGGLFNGCRAGSCPGDIAPRRPDGTLGNAVVNIDDLLTVISTFGAPGGAGDVAPVYEDGTWGNAVVDLDDVIAALQAFGPCDQ